MLWDHLRVLRFERQIRLRERVCDFLAERGMDGPTRTIALKIGLPLLDNATLEEDDELQDVWARLLVNGGDADSGIEMRRAFVSVLAEMTALDVRNLASIEAIPVSRRDASVYNRLPTLEVLTQPIPKHRPSSPTLSIL